MWIFFKLKNIRKYFSFNYSLPFSRLIFFKSQIKVPQALDSSMLICKREISACLSVALSFDLFVLIRCILLIFQLPLMKLNILLIMNNFKSSTEWKSILKERFTLLIIYFFVGFDKKHFWNKVFTKGTFCFPKVLHLNINMHIKFCPCSCTFKITIISIKQENKKDEKNLPYLVFMLFCKFKQKWAYIKTFTQKCDM